MINLVRHTVWIPVFLICLLLPSAARANRFPDPGPSSFAFTLGGSLGGFIHEDFSAFSLTVEGTVSHPIIKNVFYPWISLGLRTAMGPQRPVLMPYVEGGLWFFANIGVGYAAAFNHPAVPRHHVNLFVGVPFPVAVASGGLVVLQPYYRYGVGVARDRVVPGHEVGLMIKWFYAPFEPRDSPKKPKPRSKPAQEK